MADKDSRNKIPLNATLYEIAGLLPDLPCDAIVVSMRNLLIADRYDGSTTVNKVPMLIKKNDNESQNS